MSYETNPILNRIKILKGWKTPTFPTKTLNYSREIGFWFKIYLFLKVYLLTQNIKLLTCEIRVSETHTKLLYLSIMKHLKKKKNAKSKWKTKSFLQNLKSPLTKMQNKKARFLLYQDLKTLKSKSEFFFNRNQKKKTSQAWISKSHLSSWINFSKIIYGQRNFQKKQQKIFWKKKRSGKSKVEKNSFFTLKNNFSFDLKEKNYTLWKKKQKNILKILIKFQKNVFFLERFSKQISANFLKNSKSIPGVILNLIQKYRTQKSFLAQIQNLYSFCLTNEIKLKAKPVFFFNSSSKNFATSLSKDKLKMELKIFGFFLKKRANLFKKKIVFRFSRTKKILLKKNYLWKKIFLQSLIWNKKKITVSKFANRIFLASIERILLSEDLNYFFTTPKILSFKTPNKLRWPQLFKLLRFEQKKQLNFFGTKNFGHVWPKKTKFNERKLSYRLSFRSNYRQALILTTDLKLKYLIADLIQEYFSLIVNVKLFWPVKQFKNLKFYRLLFPQYQQTNFKKKNSILKLNDNLDQENKKYFYISQNTHHLQLEEKSFNSKNKSFLYEKLNFVLSKNFPNSDKFWSKKVDAAKKTSWNSNTLSTIFLNKLKKKNKYLILKRKIIQAQSEKRLFWASKQLFISNLILTLTLFAKYLDAQLLADQLAKIIGDTKKHALVLKIIKTILRTLRLKRGVGYRIALVGRINGANKSRIIYLKKLNRNRSRQTFLKNVNFAMSQAQATIGAFGVKVWIYS